MAQLTARPETASGLADPADARPWRWAGGLALAHVIVLFAGFSQEVAVEHSTPIAEVMHKYGTANLTRVFGGGYVEAMSFVVLIPALVILAELFGQRTQVGALAARTFLGLGLVYAGAGLAVGFAPGAAAMYWSQHGGDAHLVAALNDVRNYGFVLGVAISMAMTLALGVAAVVERIHVRWVGWTGIVLGTVGLVATPFAQNAFSMAQLVWWIGLAVLCLRGAPKNA